MNLSSIKPNFSASAVANTLVLRDANNRMVGKASELHPDGIHTMTAATTLADADELLVWEASTSTLKRITKSAFNLSMNNNNAVARYSGLKGSHARVFIYGGTKNETSWASTSGGNILITVAGTYKFTVAHGNVYALYYQQAGTGTLRLLQNASSIASYAQHARTDYPSSGGANQFSVHANAAVNDTFAFEFVASGHVYYGGGGWVEVEKLT
jgi:hypothetical protein